CAFCLGITSYLFFVRSFLFYYSQLLDLYHNNVSFNPNDRSYFGSNPNSCLALLISHPQFSAVNSPKRSGYKTGVLLEFLYNDCDNFATKDTNAYGICIRNDLFLKVSLNTSAIAYLEYT